VRTRSVVAVVLAGVMVVGLGAYVGDRGLKSRQRTDYRAGHAAYLRGDCERATPRLLKAQVGWLDHAVSARAGDDLAGCRSLQAVRAKAAKAASPASAASMYITYLQGERDAQLAAVARRQARAVLTSVPLEQAITPELCLMLPIYHVLTLTRAEPLAPAFLAACGKVQEDSDPAAAFTAYDQLHTDFPASPQARSTIPALGRMAVRVALPMSSEDWPALRPYQADGSLHASARMVVQNNGTGPISMLFVGRTTRLAGVGGCSSCASESAKTRSQCPGRGRSFTVILPPGRYSIVRIDAAWLQGGPSKGTWNLKPGLEYRTCFHQTPGVS
jgi:hypothetical protein